MGLSEPDATGQDKGKFPPGLYLVATPIGAARDITLRALDILLHADVLAAEDTRSAQRLMEIHGIARAGRPMIAYHDHSGPGTRAGLIQRIAEGARLAYVSEAGTPLVADPGYKLAQDVIAAGQQVYSAPGASAALAALLVSGLPSDRFLFAGFPPARGAKQLKWLKAQAACQATVIFYESPKRVHHIFENLREAFGADTHMALCRELTKRHEEVIRGAISEVQTAIDGKKLLGEIVLVIGPMKDVEMSEADVDEALKIAMDKGPIKEAAATVAKEFGLAKRDMYQRALALKDKWD